MREMKVDLPVFGNEVELDEVLYVSVDFVKQYPEYMDTELEEKLIAEAGEDSLDSDDKEFLDDGTPSEYKSQISINGSTYIAVPMLMANPNYIELKYVREMDVSLETFIPQQVLSEGAGASILGRRRRRN